MNKLTDYCSRNKIEYLDLTPIFSAEEKKEALYFDADIHWNKKGHLMASKEIYKFIKEKGIIPVP